MPNEKSLMRINKLVPILAVPDILAAMDYYTRVLGFEREWIWGDPATHAAVGRNGVQIQLTLNPHVAERAAGTEYFLFVDAVDEFHALHRGNGAKIVSPIENKPWGAREYTVCDLCGYELRFAGQPPYERPADARSTLPGNIRLIQRLPTVEEYLELVKSVNWTYKAEIVVAALAGSISGIVAVDESATGGPKTVGMLRIVGDGAAAFYIQDVVVMPSHQNQRVGTAMVEAAVAYLRATTPGGGWLGLFTIKPSFYERLGFQFGGGMHLKV